MNKLSVDHLLGIKSLNESDINLIFKTASHFKEVINRPIKRAIKNASGSIYSVILKKLILLHLLYIFFFSE